MRRVVMVLIAGLLFVAAARANPLPVAILSEIQVAPDSEQRLEVNAKYYPGGAPVDMSGWRVISRACTLTVDSGVVISDTNEYLVLDQNNLSGKLRLRLDSDEVTITDTSGTQIEDQLSYPGPQGWDSCFRPPAGMSCVPHYYFEGIPPDQYLARLWFVASPTFGGPNPDTSGRISGTVRNQSSQPLCSASVCISGPEGIASTLSQSDGSYMLAWIGPGIFQVTANKDGHTGQYPDSVVLTENESRSGVDITVPYTGAAEPPKVNLKFDWRGNWLRVSTPEPALADLRTVNVAGRVCGRLQEMLRAGETELHPLGALPAGVYLVQGAIEKEKVNRKVTVFR